MGAWNWPQFLDQHGVAYRTTGRNVGAGRLVVKCPFCGAADPSEHMGILLNGEAWGCLRDKTHRGKSKIKLVMALLNCSHGYARTLVGNEDAGYMANGSFADEFDKLFDAGMNSGTHAMNTKPALTIPKEFRAFGSGKFSEAAFANHLRGRRNLSDQQIRTLTTHFDMYYCVSGLYAQRIIFTAHEQGELKAWTGRAISDRAMLRYRSIPKEIAVVSHYLLWYDDLLEADADTLILVEGPFDALKLNLLGWRAGIRATCCFTSAPTAIQIHKLHVLVRRYKRRLLMLDQGTELMAMNVLADMRGLNFEPLTLTTRKDPDQIRTTKELLDIIGDPA